MLIKAIKAMNGDIYPLELEINEINRSLYYTFVKKYPSFSKNRIKFIEGEDNIVYMYVMNMYKCYVIYYKDDKIDKFDIKIFNENEEKITSFTIYKIFGKYKLEKDNIWHNSIDTITSELNNDLRNFLKIRLLENSTSHNNSYFVYYE